LNSSGQEGVLASDSMLRSLQSSLLSMVTTSVSGAGQYVNLQSMGIEMQNDGTLQLNSANLSKALSSNYSDVQTFFQSPKGWGVNVGTQLLHMTDPILGMVSADVNGLKQTSDSLTNQISDFETRMVTVQAQLTTQYANLNTLLQSYPMQLQAIAGQLSSLPGATSSNS
jgi:flagellar hook-associated protein 2